MSDETADDHTLALEHREIPLAQLREDFYRTSPTELQRRGTAFMIQRETVAHHNQFGGVICDSIGLGKTLMTLSAIVEQLYTTMQTTGHRQKTLVVASSTVCQEWVHQAQDHLVAGTLRVKLYHGPQRQCLSQDDYDVLVTTYSLVTTEFSKEAHIGDDTIPSHWKGLRGQRSPFDADFDRVVLDEAHAIRNASTKTSSACCHIRARCRWAITATPVFNDIHDWYGIIKFLDAFPYCVKETFSNFITRVVTRHPHAAVNIIREFLLPIEIRRGKHHLQLPPLTEEVMYVDLSQDERLFYDAYFDFSRDTIERLFSVQGWLRNTGWGRQGNNMAARARFAILSMILRLRQACVHPQLVIDSIRGDSHDNDHNVPQDSLYSGAIERLHALLEQRQAGNSPDECAVCLVNEPHEVIVPCGHVFCDTCAATLFALGNPRCPLCREPIHSHVPVSHVLEVMDGDGNEQAVENDDLDVRVERPRQWNDVGTKVQHVIDHFEQELRREPTTKALFFSQWLGVLDILQEELTRREIPFLRIDGNVKHASDRYSTQREFNQSETTRVLLCSLHCTNQGMNLQGANVVYLFDLWWNDAVEEQAGGRIHRVGQTKPCKIYHVVARGTIEEKILELQSRKRTIADATTGSKRLRDDWEYTLRSLLDRPSEVNN